MSKIDSRPIVRFAKGYRPTKEPRVNICPRCRTAKDKAIADEHSYTLEVCDACKLKILNNKVNRTPAEERLRLAIIKNLTKFN